MATDIYWHSSLPKKVLRNSTWSEIEGFISDKTRSGKTKRRMYASKEKRPFNVEFQFTLQEYKTFSSWYKNSILFGAKSFMFPRIDSDNGEYIEYRIAAGGAPNYSNPSGDIVRCTMKWEEV